VEEKENEEAEEEKEEDEGKVQIRWKPLSISLF